MPAGPAPMIATRSGRFTSNPFVELAHVWIVQSKRPAVRTVIEVTLVSRLKSRDRRHIRPRQGALRCGDRARGATLERSLPAPGSGPQALGEAEGLVVR